MSSFVCASCGAGFLSGEPAGALCSDCEADTLRLQATALKDAARTALGRYEQAGDGYVEALAEVCRSVLTL